MRRVRAYSRAERKRLIIHTLAKAIREGETGVMTCAEIANKMDIVASTKLRGILREMVLENDLHAFQQEDAGIAGFRWLYSLDQNNPAFSVQHANAKAVRRTRSILLNIGGKVEALQL